MQVVFRYGRAFVSAIYVFVCVKERCGCAGTRPGMTNFSNVSNPNPSRVPDDLL
jgi:hypothetical protein